MITARSLDHFVAYAQDLGVGSAAWRRLGFTVMPIMEHVSIGTSNAIVQFERTYLELIGDVDHCVVPTLRDSLRRSFPSYDGFYMVSFTSNALERDREPLVAAGVVLEPIVNASRRVRLPAGGWIDTASRSMYAFHRERPRMSLFLSDHPKPEAIWIPDYQAHANSASDVVALHYAARDVSADVEFVSRLIGGRPAEAGADRAVFRTPLNQRLELHSERAARSRWPEFAGLQGEEPVHGIGLTIRVGSLAQCRRALRDGGVPHRATQDRGLVVPATHATGVFLEFVEKEASV